MYGNQGERIDVSRERADGLIGRWELRSADGRSDWLNETGANMVVCGVGVLVEYHAHDGQRTATRVRDEYRPCSSTRVARSAYGQSHPQSIARRRSTRVGGGMFLSLATRQVIIPILILCSAYNGVLTARSECVWYEGPRAAARRRQTSGKGSRCCTH